MIRAQPARTNRSPPPAPGANSESGVEVAGVGELVRRAWSLLNSADAGESDAAAEAFASLFDRALLIE